MPFIDPSALDKAPAGGKFLSETDLDKPQEAPGALEALGRGALQGASLGFSDEITGAIQSLFGSKTYEQARDESRAANTAAQDAHSTLYGAGELGGGIASTLIPGLGVAKGAGIVKTGLQAAVAGGLSGLGTSEAKSAGGLASDTAQGAAIGGVGGALLHGISSKVGELVGKAPAMADEQAIKALAQGEGKAGAAWSKTRGMVSNDATAQVINEKIPFEGKSISLADIASKPAEEVRPVVKTQIGRIGDLTDKIYDKADAKTGGTKLSDLLTHIDDQIAERGQTPGNKAFINALTDIKTDLLDTWGSKAAHIEGHPEDTISLKDALKAGEGQPASVKAALLKNYDVKVPSRDVRAFATTLQERGSDTIDRLNPGVASQVKKEMGSIVRNYVNDHVESVLGSEDADALKALNRRTTSLYRIDDVLADRENKEAAGRVNGKGLVNTLIGHGGAVGAGLMALHGNIPGAAAALAIPKILEKAPAVGRLATRGLANADQLLSKIAQAADQGNPWAQRQLQLLRSSPQGVARLAALQAGAPSLNPSNQ